MAVVRWGRSAFEAGPTIPKVRWGRSAFEGTAPTTPKARWGRSALEGTASVVVAPLTGVTDRLPGTSVSFTAALASAGTADLWTWRQVSGPAVSLIGSGASRTFLAPSVMPPDGATVVLGVRATVSGTLSPEVTVSTTVLPQRFWILQAGQWVGKRPRVPVSA